MRVSSPDALAEVQRATSAPIAVGETLAGLPAFRDLIARGGAQIVIFDVGWVGGVTEARTMVGRTLPRTAASRAPMRNGCPIGHGCNCSTSSRPAFTPSR